ncbi:hypothetical protein COOONC_16234 [Cooperia oncophora]
MKSVAVLRSVSRLAGKAVRMNFACHVPVRAISTSQRGRHRYLVLYLSNLVLLIDSSPSEKSCDSIPAFNVAPELAQALTREIEAEQQLSQENLGGSAAPSFHGFKLTTKEAEVRLTKQHGNESILVVFNVNHSVDMDEGFDDEAQPEAAPVPVALPPFTVEITKGGERLCFHLELVESVDVQGEYDFRVYEEFTVRRASSCQRPAMNDVASRGSLCQQ